MKPLLRECDDMLNHIIELAEHNEKYCFKEGISERLRV